MVDSGASTIFINRKFVEENKIRTRKLRTPIVLLNIDGSRNADGYLSEIAVLDLVVGSHREKAVFAVTQLGEDVILGIDWLRRHNPSIDWTEGTLALDRCPEGCGRQRKAEVEVVSATRDTGARPTARLQKQRKPMRVQSLKHRKGVTVETVDEEGPQPSPDPADRIYDYDNDADLFEMWANGPTRLPDDAPTLFVHAGYTYSQLAAEELASQKHQKTFEELVPPQYREFADVFSKKASERLPERKPYDHAIELVPGYSNFRSKVYPLSLPEQAELDKFIAENLEKGYIQPSKSPLSAGFFFVKKKEGTLRPVQDYRKLNEITIKNSYPLPLISDIVDKLAKAKIYSKLDIRWGYNNVRIKEGDEWKAAFVTPRGLYEPTVMFFGLTNSPATFQGMMDDIFKDLILEGKVLIYLDDILILGDSLKEHRELVREVLRRLRKHDLFAKPEKCEFEVTRTEYLGLIISPGRIEMDPAKVKAIREWPTPKNASDIRRFRGFANFYRRFIQDFGRICKPLDRLTGKVPFVWGDEEQTAFDMLKARFTSSPMLSMWDHYKPHRIETDASGYAVGSVLMQKEDDGLWHPVAYLSEGMTETERNYEIWDREMLAIIRSLESWRDYLEGAPDMFEIWSDHKNLEYWRTTRDLTRRQARWALYLSRFDFVIRHKPGKTNLAADALSRNPEHQRDDGSDNHDQIVLKPERFITLSASYSRGHAGVEGDRALLKRIRECSERDEEVATAIQTIQKLGPKSLSKGIEEWNSEDGIVLFRGKVYVPKDTTIRRDIVKIHHDSLAAGHPGRWKTQELVSRNYWWPGMTKFINEYVMTCDVCQRTKAHRAAPQGPLQPNQIPEGPWQIITSDLIVGLPKSDGYTAILVTADRFTKQVHLSATTDEVDAAECARLFIRDVFKLHGAPKRIITDRGPQFASRYLRRIYEGIGVKPSMSTAFHPQTDGQTERWNQEIEQYLRIFVDYRQEDWTDLLPIAEFALNSRVHSATSQSPFFLNYGYNPEFTVAVGPSNTVPQAELRLKALREVQTDAKAALELAAERMKYFYDQNRSAAPEFQPGDKVMLDGKNLRVERPSRKLSDKFYGPYEVKRKIGQLNYELKLPKSMAVHPVFHVQLLSKHQQNRIPGRVQPPAPPVVVDGEEEWEVEKVLDSRVFRRQFQYKIKWKDYGDHHNSWQPLSDVANATEAIAEFHKAYPSAPRPVSKKSFASLPFKPLENFTETSVNADIWHGGIHGRRDVAP